MDSNKSLLTTLKDFFDKNKKKWTFWVGVFLVVGIISGIVNSANRNPQQEEKKTLQAQQTEQPKDKEPSQNPAEEAKLPEYEILKKDTQNPGGGLFIDIYTTSHDDQEIINLSKKLVDEYVPETQHLYVRFFDDKDAAKRYDEDIVKLKGAENEELLKHWTYWLVHSKRSGVKELKKLVDVGGWMDWKIVEQPKEVTQPKTEEKNISQNNSSEEQKPKTKVDLLWEAFSQTNIGVKDGFEIQFDEKQGVANIIAQKGDYWDEYDIVGRSYSNFVKYGTKAFELDGINKIKYTTKAPIVDKFGKEAFEDGVIIAMTKDQFSKFSWENMKGKPIHSSIYWNDFDEVFVNAAIAKVVNQNPEKIKFY